MEQQRSEPDPVDLLLAKYVAHEHIASIKADLQRQHVPLDPEELREIIASCATIGPCPFKGFGATPEEHIQRVSILHAVKMMCISHHDEPWEDD